MVLPSTSPARVITCTWCCALTATAVAAGAAAQEEKRNYRFPRGDAATILAQFATESGRPILFMMDTVRGEQTNAVSGTYTLHEALERLLAGTSLVAVYDPKSNGFIVNRRPASTPRPRENDHKSSAGRGPDTPVSQQNTARPKTMQPQAPLRRAATLLALITSHLIGAQPAPDPAKPDTEPAIELSPFVVRDTDAVGYAASSTLAGTRLNTALRDVGASISVVTAEFLKDTASTNLGEFLQFTTAMEVGGVFGNFAGGAESNGRPDQSESRENPQNNQRVRGIGAASNTRDFFLTDIPMDSYNTSRVTISRGPNSLLFGIGNPAGIIDTSLNRAQLTRNRNEVSARYGTKDSYRGTLDLNRVLVKDRLALRFSTVAEQNNYKQEPAFDRKRRFYGALNTLLRDDKKGGVLGKTSLRASFEAGDSQSTPVNVIPPVDAFSIFFQPPNPALDQLPGIDLNRTVLQGSPGYIWAPRVTVDNRGSSSGIPQNNGAYYAVPWFIQIPLVFDTPGQRMPGYLNSNIGAVSSLSGVMGRIRYATPPNNRPAVDHISTVSMYALTPGFTTPTLQNRAIFDYRNRLISGGSNRVEQDFDAGTVAITQEFFDGRAGVELAFDKQKISSERMLPFSFGQNGAGNGQSDIYIDVSRYLSNDQPNPDVGRPFMQQLGVQDRIQHRNRESFRATAFYRLDLEDRRKTLFGIPLGNHTFAGLYNTQLIDVRTESFQTAWESATRDLTTTVFQSTISDGFRRSPVLVQYLGPSVLNAGSTNDVRITEVFNGQLPRDGDVHRVTFFDFVTKEMVTEPLTIHRFLNGLSLGRQRIGSESFSVKSDFFRDTLVTTFGWRWDRLRTYANETSRRLPDGTLDPDLRLNSNPNLDERGRNFTWSIVGRYPRRYLPKLPAGMDLSAFYNKSGNFNPTSIRSNLNGQIIPAPAGSTKEYGILIEILDRRASLRLNWFETLQTNSSNNAQGATGALFNFPSFMVTRYRDAQTQGIDFAAIPGVTAAGYSSYQQLYDAFFKLLPEPTNTLKNMRWDANGIPRWDGIPGLTDTSNLNAKGFEAELVGNLTRRLRVSFNVAEQKTVVDGSARLTKQISDAVYDNMVKLNLLGIDQGPALAERMSASQRYTIDVNTPLAATVARDGAVSLEQRRWRANFVATYDFRGVEHPILNKMSVGTGVRWQDKIAIGNPFLTGERLKQKIVATNSSFKSTAEISDNNPVMQTQFPDLENPIYGPAEFAGDFWVGYRRKIFRNIDWSLQLNVRNAWGNEDDMPVKANPDGTIAVIRIPNETRWYLSSTFTF